VAQTAPEYSAKWLLHLGKEKDVTVNLRHLMDFGDNGYQIKVLNEDKIIDNRRDLVLTAGKYV